MEGGGGLIYFGSEKGRGQGKFLKLGWVKLLFLRYKNQAVFTFKSEEVTRFA